MTDNEVRVTSSAIIRNDLKQRFETKGPRELRARPLRLTNVVEVLQEVWLRHIDRAAKIVNGIRSNIKKSDG